MSFIRILRKTIGTSVAFFSLVVICFSSCRTYPVEPYSSDECLVIIKSVVRNPQGLGKGRAYAFHLSDRESPVPVTSKITVIKTMEPGVSIKYLTSKVQQGYSGESSKNTVEWPLPYEPGSVVVADFQFVQELKRKDDSTVISSVKIEKISTEEMQVLIEEVKNQKKYKAWFMQPGELTEKGFR